MGNAAVNLYLKETQTENKASYSENTGQEKWN